MHVMGMPTRMSFAEFELLGAGADEVELLRGELIRLPPRQRKHREICERLFELYYHLFGVRLDSGCVLTGPLFTELSTSADETETLSASCA